MYVLFVFENHTVELKTQGYSQQNYCMRNFSEKKILKLFWFLIKEN